MTGRNHPSARTDAQIRQAIRESSESNVALARKYGINPKTVAKWRKRGNTADMPAGPKRGCSRSITVEEEEIIVRFRKHTQLPLDDCLYALQAHIPHLTRSTLHRCFRRHGISRVPVAGADNGEAIALLANPIGCLNIDAVQVQVGERKSYLFNAVDQTSKLAFVHMANHDDSTDAVAFLDNLVATLPFRIERIFTPDAAPFTLPDAVGIFTRRCAEHGIEHHFITMPHSSKRNRLAGVNKLIRDSVTFTSQKDLARLLRNFVHAYNFRRRLKTLRGRTPFEFVCHAWEQEPKRFLRDPHHEMVGPETMPGSPRGGI